MSIPESERTLLEAKTFFPSADLLKAILASLHRLEDRLAAQDAPSAPAKPAAPAKSTKPAPKRRPRKKAGS